MMCGSKADPQSTSHNTENGRKGVLLKKKIDIHHFHVTRRLSFLGNDVTFHVFAQLFGPISSWCWA